MLKVAWEQTYIHGVKVKDAAGAAMLVIAGPLLDRYAHRLMLSQARQQISGAPEAGGGTA